MNTQSETVDQNTGEVISAPQAPVSAHNPADKSIRSFSVVLSALEGGSFNAELSKELRDLIADLNDHMAAYGGKAVAGKIDIALNLKLADGILEISADKKITKPKAKRGRSIFWVTPENNLSQENPQQRTFGFAEQKRPRPEYLNQ